MRFYFEIGSTVTGQDCSVIIRHYFKVSFLLTGLTCSCEDRSSKIAVIYCPAYPTSSLIVLQAVMSYDELPLKHQGSSSSSVRHSPVKNTRGEYLAKITISVSHKYIFSSNFKLCQPDKSSIPELRKLLLWESKHNNTLPVTAANPRSQHPGQQASHKNHCTSSQPHSSAVKAFQWFYSAGCYDPLSTCVIHSEVYSICGGKITDSHTHAEVCQIDSDFPLYVCWPREAAEEETNSAKVFMATQSLWGRDVVPKIGAGKSGSIQESRQRKQQFCPGCCPLAAVGWLLIT